jgi:RHH-type proline utilization regulon transcriptional repressor/proline dehydrogenase/delta 1-pyrroline-5-carboxylate dehydrogenase
MLVGAVRCLSIGRPERWDTDLGPLIDEEARRVVQNAIDQLRCSSKPIFLSDGPLDTSDTVVGPTIFEITDLSRIRGEIFGPVLQVMRWKGDALPLIEQINALGYGLTFGLQTRIDHRMDQWAQVARAGNVYVNRNMVGAVVGVQPFGGNGLSGTGPKAGGPHYLQSFCIERTFTVNETALGGNISLLSSAS